MLSRNLRTFNQFGQISGVLGFDGNTHDRGHGELHDLHVVSVLEGGQGSGLDEELVNTNETTDVTGGDILDGLDTSTHHENGSLKQFYRQNRTKNMGKIIKLVNIVSKAQVFLEMRLSLLVTREMFILETLNNQNSNIPGLISRRDPPSCQGRS